MEIPWLETYNSNNHFLWNHFSSNSAKILVPGKTAVRQVAFKISKVHRSKYDKTDILYFKNESFGPI